MNSRAAFDEYERLLAPARERFAVRSGVALLESPTVDAVLMESFLLHFCAIGTRMTESVESWLHRSAALAAIQVRVSEDVVPVSQVEPVALSLISKSATFAAGVCRLIILAPAEPCRCDELSQGFERE